MLYGGTVALICATVLSCGNADDVPDPPQEFLEIEVVPKSENCFISGLSTSVLGNHPAGARLIARSNCMHAGGLRISDVPGIRNLHFLDGVSTSGPTVVSGNRQLTSLNGMGSLSRVDTLEITDNHSLRTLEGLDALERVKPREGPLDTSPTTPGLISIRYNESLESLAGLGNLKTANSLVIHHNPNLDSIEAIHGMKSLDYLSIVFTPVPRCQIDRFLGELESPPDEVEIRGVASGECESE
jgi:hypothetical protein